jgi:hypothetical protein
MRRWTLRDRWKYGWTDPATILDMKRDPRKPLDPPSLTPLVVGLMAALILFVWWL